MKRILSTTLLVASLLILNACAVKKTVDRSLLAERNPRSIVVIPPANETVEVNAPYIYLSTITRPLAEMGYYVFPVAVIDHFFKENGLPTTAEMNLVSLNKLREHIGADAVLYVTLQNWGQKYEILSSRAVVTAELKLVDAKNGDVLWTGRAHAEQSSSDSGGGLAAALVQAALSQAIGSMIDQTFDLARTANENLILDKDIGLLTGPYKVKVDSSAKVTP